MDKVMYKIDGKLTDNVIAVIAYMRRNKLTKLTDLIYWGEDFERVENEAPKKSKKKK